ncbi:MAG: hypothetical protein ACLRPR_05310 [Eisenbergiella sp.]
MASSAARAASRKNKRNPFEADRYRPSLRHFVEHRRFFWAVLFLFSFQLLYGQKKHLVLYLPFIGTVLTLLIATPVASDLRYAYPLFLAMPFLFAVSVPSNSPIVFSSENG